MVQVMLARHEDLLVGVAVPVGDPSQLLMPMLNCRELLPQSWRLSGRVRRGGGAHKE